MRSAIPGCRSSRPQGPKGTELRRLLRRESWPSLPFSERFADVGFEIVLGGQAEAGGDDGARAVDEEGRGKDIDVAVGLADAVAVDQDGITDAELLGRFGDVGFLLGQELGVVLVEIVDGDGEDLETFGRVLLFELDEPGSFDLAGRAPGG